MLMLTLLLACARTEPNIIETTFDPTVCPLDGETVRANASSEVVAPTPGDLSDWSTAQSAWQAQSTEMVRDMVNGTEASDVAITHSIGSIGPLRATRFTFEDGQFDRSDLETVTPEWTSVPHLPCDFTELSATADISIRFDEGGTLIAPGELRTATGGVREALWFSGQTTSSVNLSLLHPALAALSQPTQVSIAVNAAEPPNAWGSLWNAEGQRVVDFGPLEGASTAEP